MRSYPTLLLALPLMVTGMGCASTEQARYVYQDREFGVVGIPANTDRWPNHYRTQADRLMQRHFPEGHEIVRAEEVVEGSCVLTTEGTNTAELAPELPIDLLKIAKLGRVARRSQADTLKIKECRIIYRRAPRPAESASNFAELPALTPTQYVDPNAVDRAKANEPETARTTPADSSREANADPRVKTS